MELGPDTKRIDLTDDHTGPDPVCLSIPCYGAGENTCVDYSPELCIRREPESLLEDALIQLQNRVPLIFSGPRGFGKRWLMQDLLHELNRNNRYSIKYVDVGNLRKEALSISEFLEWFAERIDPDLASAFRNARRSNLRSAMTELMGRYLEDLTPPFILAIGNTDRILDRPFGKDFFRLLRGWLNKVGGQSERWRKFHLVMSTERDIGRLNRELRPAPPFNIGEEVPVNKPFSDAEVVLLAEKLGVSLTEKQKEDIDKKCGNQPSLTAVALYLMREWGEDCDKDCNGQKADKDDERICAVENNLRLRRYLEELEQELRRDADLFEAFKVVRDPPGTDWEPKVHEPLERLGLVVREPEFKLTGSVYKEIQ
uniref:AAA-like domain-containing protein n=1 Tax=Candidatus Kentrum sp. LPFa TaxID=2126335 RepID=A0A450WCF5_9GAMM|nr:MAG: AAA-like domain-containing protein [Candidatus Kentron sp. LPFa]